MPNVLATDFNGVKGGIKSQIFITALGDYPDCPPLAELYAEPTAVTLVGPKPDNNTGETWASLAALGLKVLLDGRWFSELCDYLLALKACPCSGMCRYSGSCSLLNNVGKLLQLAQLACARRQD